MTEALSPEDIVTAALYRDDPRGINPRRKARLIVVALVKAGWLPVDAVDSNA